MNIQELIDAGETLCRNLEIASENEKIFCHDVQNMLEVYSWEMLRMTNQLKEIKEHTGG
jgi:hypothetical protein